MPPKIRSNGKESLTKIKPRLSANKSTTDLALDPPTLSGLDLEAENKFELELCWCIQQLELSVNTGSLPEKQLKNSRKNLELLKSNNVALIQKRQIMRTTFGNYREKMLQEEKKNGKAVSSVKFSDQKLNMKKFIFLRRAQSASAKADHNEDDKLKDGKSTTIKKSTLFSETSSNEPFTFNFS